MLDINKAESVRQFAKTIYISHPYQNKKSNKKKVEKIIRGLTKTFPNYLFISPIHAFGFLYTDVPYSKGLDMSLSLLDNTDEMWVYGKYQESKGCRSEIAYCKEYNIPYQINDENIWVK